MFLVFKNKKSPFFWAFLLDVLTITFIPQILIFLLFIVLSFFFKNININMYVSIIISCVIFPNIYTHNRKIKKEKLDNKKLLFLFLYLILFIVCYKDNLNLFYLNIIVGFSEEFLFRYILNSILKEYMVNYKVINMLNIIFFVFGFHNGRGFLENLIIRVPISLVLQNLFMKYKNLYLNSFIHSFYNIILSMGVL